jgi:hypothetical protein
MVGRPVGVFGRRSLPIRAPRLGDTVQWTGTTAKRIGYGVRANQRWTLDEPFVMQRTYAATDRALRVQVGA